LPTLSKPWRSSSVLSSALRIPVRAIWDSFSLKSLAYFLISAGVIPVRFVRTSKLDIG
jgi:hypothetical protein